MELDTNILQTRTVTEIVNVLRNVERELIIPKNKDRVGGIINKHEIAISLVSSYK